jgi:hypothetical protein
MTAKRKCENENEACRGRVAKVIDPYQEELFGEKVSMVLCEWHLQERRDEV